MDRFTVVAPEKSAVQDCHSGCMLVPSDKYLLISAQMGNLDLFIV